MDDTASRILSIFLVEKEGTAPRFRGFEGGDPAADGSAFVSFVGDLDNTLCLQEERVVAHDNTLRYERRVPQTPEQSHRRHFVKAKVRVREYPDGNLAIFHGPRRLARSPADGRLQDPDAITRSAA